MVGKTVALLEQKNDMRALLSASLTGESRTTCALSVKRQKGTQSSLAQNLSQFYSLPFCAGFSSGSGWALALRTPSLTANQHNKPY